MRLGAAILMTVLGLFLSFGFAQTLPPKEPATVPTEQNAGPTLGFISRKNVYPVFQTDMYDMAMNENEIFRRLAQAKRRYELLLNDPNLGDRWDAQKELSQIETNLAEYAKIRQLRDSLMRNFLDAFRDSKECKGITFYTSEGQKPAFTVQLSVGGVLSNNQTWGWWLRWPGDPSPAHSDGHGFGGTGTQSSARLTARDVCLKIWDDVDPSHSKTSGGRIK